MDARGNGAAAGVIGPLVFVGVFLIEGALRPGYDAAADFVSALSLGPRGWVQIASFLLTGACLILFAAWLRATFPSGPSSIAGPLLLGLIGAGLFASGPLVMDPAGTPLDAATWHGMAHNILGALVFVLMPVAMFVWLRRIRREPRLGGFWRTTLFLALVTVVADLVFSLASKVPAWAEATAPWAGALQRAVLVPFLVWVALFGAVLLGASRRRAARPALAGAGARR